MGEVFGTGASDTEARGVVMASETAARAYHVVDFAEVPSVPCLCEASDSSEYSWRIPVRVRVDQAWAK